MKTHFETILFQLDIRKVNETTFVVSVLDDDLNIHRFTFSHNHDKERFEFDFKLSSVDAKNFESLKPLILKAESRLSELGLKFLSVADLKNIRFHEEWDKLATRRDTTVAILLNQSKYLSEKCGDALRKELKETEAKLEKLEAKLFDEGWE